MARGYRLPLWELDVLDRACPACGRTMYICDHRYRRFHTLEGPVQLVCKLNHCPDRDCPGHATTKSPEQEATIAPPSWAIGWDVFCWIGHRRCSRHMSIPHIQSELLDDYAIKLSDDAIAKYIRRYQVMLAARQQDPEALRRQYESVDEIVLSIDGLQSEKGHETLYVASLYSRQAGRVVGYLDFHDIDPRPSPPREIRGIPELCPRSCVSSRKKNNLVISM